MSTPSTPILNPPLATQGNENLISRSQFLMDWAMLQKFLGSNIPTIGTDAAASGADPTGQQDSTVALQQILNSQITAQGRSVLYLRPNTVYKISAPLILSGTCLSTLIYGGGVIFLDSFKDCPMILGNPNGNTLTILGVNLVGSGRANTVGVQLLAGADHSIVGCNIANCNYNILLQPILGQTVENVLIEGNICAGAATSDLKLDNTFGAIHRIRVANNALDSAAPMQGFPSATLSFTTRGNTSGPAATYKVRDSDYDQPIPQALAYSNAVQTINSNVQTPLIFDNAITRGGIWVAGQPTRLTAPVDGTYTVFGELGWGTFVAGALQGLSIAINGALTTSTTTGPMQWNIQVVGPMVQLVGGDYIELWAIQQSGVAKNTLGNAYVQGSLVLLRIP